MLLHRAASVFCKAHFVGIGVGGVGGEAPTFEAVPRILVDILRPEGIIAQKSVWLGVVDAFKGAELVSGDSVMRRQSGLHSGCGRDFFDEWNPTT